jgi:RNA polymerase sigma-70 factor (ECF subfamily)
MGGPSTSSRGIRRYAELFNRRDWDALRALMSEESRLDVVTRTRRRGAAASEYYTRYAEIAPREDLRTEAGWVDGRLVLAVFRPASSTVPCYFLLVEWQGEKIALIRDYRYVPYITEASRYTPSEAT